jgi:hypothetical protein
LTVERATLALAFACIASLLAIVAIFLFRSDQIFSAFFLMLIVLFLALCALAISAGDDS